MNIDKVLQLKKCRGCGVCAAICPVGAIEMKCNKQGFYYASILDDKCVSCGKCGEVCSVLHPDATKGKKARNVFYAHNKSEERRMQSASGGIVGALVEAAINEGYAVAGAAYDFETNRVRHIVVHSVTDYYSKICGSKYIPSDTVDAFRAIAQLDKVLIIGTPCQIQALRKAYPQKELLFVDFKCYGVCGYTLWDKYIASIRREHPAKIIELNSRSKHSSWLKWGVELHFSDGTQYFKPKTTDLFGKVFSGLGHAGERCLECKLSGEYSLADIRVEDAWQLSDYLTNDDYKKGASQVTVMTEEGERIWKLATQFIVSKEVGTTHAIHGVVKDKPRTYLNELIARSDTTMEEIVRCYYETIPKGKRCFDYFCNLLFEVPTMYFFAKRIYRKLKKIDK